MTNKEREKTVRTYLKEAGIGELEAKKQSKKLYFKSEADEYLEKLGKTHKYPWEK